MMKKTLILLTLFLNVLGCFATDYSRIDKQSKSVPSELKTVEQIASYLTKDLRTPTGKTRAIYIWIAHNIRYDLAALKSADKTTDKNALDFVNEAIYQRKGVCAHYAELFHAMCQKVDIKSYVIIGYTREKDGKIPSIAHAWNAVKIDNSYYLVDATWAAGYTLNDNYVHSFTDNFFFVKPTEFIKTHIPFDPIWQFLDNPLSNKDIQSANWKKIKSKGNYNYADSITVTESLPNIEKYIRIRNRIVKSGITNDLIQEQVSYYQLLIANEKYNSSVDKLNDAVSRYNKSVENYNLYVNNKNLQFKNGASLSEQSLTLLADARKEVEQAAQIASLINSDDKLLNNKVSNLQQSISDLTGNINKEDEFMKKYQKKPKTFNVFEFLKSLFH